jgi:hypothetical protein
MNYAYEKKRHLPIYRILPVIVSLSLLTACSLPGASGTSASLASDVSGTVSGNMSDTAVVSSVSSGFDDEDKDATWDKSSSTLITLNGTSASVDGSGASADQNIITITSSGTYVVSGTLSDGQIVIDTKDSNSVRLVLNGASVTSSASAPIYVENAAKVVLILADGTENTLADGSDYTYSDEEEEEPNAALFSKSDLTINGTGSLSIDANFKHGINCKDTLKILDATINVDAVSDGIRGKDSIEVQNASLTVNAGSDGMQSSNDTDSTLGFIVIDSGTFRITAGNDGIQAETTLLIKDGDFTLTTGGGSANATAKSNSQNVSGGQGSLPGASQTTETTDTSDDTASDSMKGLKAGTDLSIQGGSLTVDSADDSIHSGGSLEVTDGTLTLSTGDDGLHAESTMQLDGGTVTVSKSYEGIEAALMTINGGTYYITSSDDAINVAGGTDSSSNTAGGMNAMASTGVNNLFINGGYIYADAGGDGLDANASITMTGGTAIVNGPTNDGNGALDYAGTFNITGGLLIAAGSSGMAQAPGSESTQNTVMIYSDTEQTAGTILHIEDESGSDVLTFAPAKNYSSVALCTSTLTTGTTYKVFFGGSSTGTVKDGLYTGGTYSGGTESTGFTVSSIVTTVGSGGGMGGGQSGAAGQGGPGGNMGGKGQGGTPPDSADGSAPSMP